VKKTVLILLTQLEGKNATLFELTFKNGKSNTDNGDLLYARLNTRKLTKSEAEEIDKQMNADLYN
jgi:hypothetical protein